MNRSQTYFALSSSISVYTHTHLCNLLDVYLWTRVIPSFFFFHSKMFHVPHRIQFIIRHISFLFHFISSFISTTWIYTRILLLLLLFSQGRIKKKKKRKVFIIFFLLMESSFIALLLFDRLRLHKSCSNRTFSCQLFFLCAFLIPFHVGWLSWDTVPTQWRGFVVPLWQLYSHPAIHGSQQPSAHRGLVTVSAWCATIATMCRDLIKVKTRRTVISALAAYSAQLNIGKRKRKRN